MGSEFVSRTELEAILSAQKSAFEGFLRTFMDSVSDRVDKLLVQVTEVKISVAGLSSKVDDQRSSSVAIQEELVKADQKLSEIESQADYLENQSRRNNLRLEGIPEAPSETWEVTEAKVRSALVTSLGLSQADAAAIPIERAHRTGKPRSPPGSSSADSRAHGRLRPVVVKFLNFKDRELILRRARERKPASLHIYEDLSARVLQTRREKLDELKSHRAAGRIAYFSFDKLVVREKKD